MLRVAKTWCDKRVSSREAPRVLDCGSGIHSYVQFPAHVHVTGIDVSKELLDQNLRLNERIHADLHEHELPAQSYDCVLCWNVLEHLEDPLPVVTKLARAVADGGLLIIGAPNPHSIKGLVTKISPYSFHLWMYRRFFNPEASREPGKGPYPTFMKRAGGARTVQQVARREGLTPAYTAWVESAMQVTLRRRFRLRGAVWRLVRSLVSIFSLGQVTSDATDYLCIFERPPRPTAESDPKHAARNEISSRRG